MAVKIKLQRLGKIRNAQYRVVVADARTRRDGRVIENIGIYHPKEEPSLIRIDSELVRRGLARSRTHAAQLVTDRDQLGRPRVEGEGCEEFADLGPAPTGAQLRARLDGIIELMRSASAAPARRAAAIPSPVATGGLVVAE